jgi:hypothetical protein
MSKAIIALFMRMNHIHRNATDRLWLAKPSCDTPVFEVHSTTSYGKCQSLLIRDPCRVIQSPASPIL